MLQCNSLYQWAGNRNNIIQQTVLSLCSMWKFRLSPLTKLSFVIAILQPQNQQLFMFLTFRSLSTLDHIKLAKFQESSLDCSAALSVYAVPNESLMCLCVSDLFQDGTVIIPSKPGGDTPAVSEVEADPGDGLGRVDCSSGDASWPSSDHADVSVPHLYLLFFLKPLFSFKLHEQSCVLLLLITFCHCHL